MIDLEKISAEGKHVSIGVVIPCYRVRHQILDVLKQIPAFVDAIIVVDDKCPESSGAHVQRNCTDPRVTVKFHEKNLGVGGAVITGYKAIIEKRIDIAVKVDGDGQMDPNLLMHFVRPIAMGVADYTKGNRFFSLETVSGMPTIRLLGNAALSFLTKLSTGYWRTFDPTNGYTAIHRSILEILPLDKLIGRYFFESEMLFRLGTVGAHVLDVPMRAKYEDEESSLKISRIVGEFAFKHLANFFRRIVYNYFLRDFSVASVQLIAGMILFVFGLVFGVISNINAINAGSPNPPGTVAVVVLSIILGAQFLMSFLALDIARTPTSALHPILTNAISLGGTDKQPKLPVEEPSTDVASLREGNRFRL